MEQKITDFLYDHEDELVETDFGEPVGEYENLDYYCKLDPDQTNERFFVLNYPGTSDWFYHYNFEDGCVYMKEIDTGNNTKVSNDFFEFMKTQLKS